MGKATDNTPDYIIYTAGDCAHNPGGPGGIGIEAINVKTKKICSAGYGCRSTTTNRMEMIAVLIALQSIPVGCKVSLFSSSQYVLNCLKGSWKKKKNFDIWGLLDNEAKRKTLDLHWVSRYEENKHINQCHKLAIHAIHAKEKWNIDEGYEKGYGEIKEDFKSSSMGRAMDVNIEIPEGIKDAKPDILDFRTYASERGIKEACAKKIRDFYLKGEPSFRAYMNLKTNGIDTISEMNRMALIKKCEDGGIAAEVIAAHLENQKDALSALRWHVRGLTLHDSIRKALVDAEVRENYVG